MKLKKMLLAALAAMPFPVVAQDVFETTRSSSNEVGITPIVLDILKTAHPACYEAMTEKYSVSSRAPISYHPRRSMISCLRGDFAHIDGRRLAFDYTDDLKNRLVERFRCSRSVNGIISKGIKFFGGNGVPLATFKYFLEYEISNNFEEFLQVEPSYRFDPPLRNKVDPLNYSFPNSADRYSYEEYKKNRLLPGFIAVNKFTVFSKASDTWGEYNKGNFQLLNSRGLNPVFFDSNESIFDRHKITINENGRLIYRAIR